MLVNTSCVFLKAIATYWLSLSIPTVLSVTVGAVVLALAEWSHRFLQIVAYPQQMRPRSIGGTWCINTVQSILTSVPFRPFLRECQVSEALTLVVNILLV